MLMRARKWKGEKESRYIIVKIMVTDQRDKHRSWQYFLITLSRMRVVQCRWPCRRENLVEVNCYIEVKQRDKHITQCLSHCHVGWGWIYKSVVEDASSSSDRSGSLSVTLLSIVHPSLLPRLVLILTVMRVSSTISSSQLVRCVTQPGERWDKCSLTAIHRYLRRARSILKPNNLHYVISRLIY